MKKGTLTLVALLALCALVGTGAALAGDKGGKCSLSAEQCCANLDAKYKEQGWLGIEKEKGKDGSLTVVSVAAGSPAERAGLKAGDVIEAINGTALTSEAGAKARHESAAKPKIGETVEYTIRRGSEQLTVKAELVKIPDTVLAELKEKHKTEHAHN